MNAEGTKFAGDLVFKIISEMLSTIFGIVTFGIISRSLPKNEYAVINQTLSMGLLVAPIILIKLNTAFCIFLPGESDLQIKKSRYFSIFLLCIPIFFILWFSIVFYKKQLSVLIFNTDTYSTEMPLIALYFILVSWSTLSIDFFRGLSKLKLAASFNWIRSGFLSLSFLVYSLIDTSLNLKIVLFVYCFIELLISISSFLFISFEFKGIPVKIEFKSLSSYFHYSLPLMPYMILAWINDNIGKFIINHMMTLEDAGIYGFNYSMVSRLFFLNYVIGYTLFPYISKYWNEKKPEKVSQYLRNSFSLGFLLTFPLALGLIATAPTIVTLLSGNNYEVDIVLIGILSLGFFFMVFYSIYSYLIDLSRKTIWFNFILIITGTVNIISNMFLIPTYGIYGAALSLMASYFVQAIITIIVSTKTAKIALSINASVVTRSMFSGLIMYLVVSKIYLDTGVLNFTFSVFIGIVCYFTIYLGITKFFRLKFL